MDPPASLTAVTNSVICSEQQCVCCCVRSSAFPHSTSFTSYHRAIDGNILISGNISVAILQNEGLLSELFLLIVWSVATESQPTLLKYFVYIYIYIHRNAES